MRITPVAVPTSLGRLRFPVARATVAACCALAVVSCGRSPTSPAGRIQVYVSEMGIDPAPGKAVEIAGTSLRDTTDKNGLAAFTVRPGSYVVRAYGINMPGPPPLYVEKSTEVAAARTSRVEFVDCTICVDPARPTSDPARN